MHLHGVVHVHEVALLHAEGLQILLLREHKAEVAPGVAREGVIGRAQQHTR